jgi:hypothetical protein
MAGREQMMKISYVPLSLESISSTLTLNCGSPGVGPWKAVWPVNRTKLCHIKFCPRS